jgi:hypothetical protein
VSVALSRGKGRLLVLNDDKRYSILFMGTKEQRKEGTPPAWRKKKSEEMKRFISSFVIKGF